MIVEVGYESPHKAYCTEELANSELDKLKSQQVKWAFDAYIRPIDLISG